MDNREGITFSVWNFLTQIAKRQPLGNASVFRKIQGIKTFLHRRGDGRITVFSNFFVSQYQKFSEGGPLCFRNVLVWKKTSWITGRVSRFPSEIFWLRLQKEQPLGNASVFRKIQVIKTFMHRRGDGGITVFSNFLVSHFRKFSEGGPLCFRNVLVWKKNYG